MNFSRWIPKRRSDWLILILLGVLLMIVAVPVGGGGKEDGAAEVVPQSGEQALTAEEYAEYLEGKLSGTLSQMEGVGQVRVMITLRDEGESLVNKDIARDGERYEESTTLTGQGSGTAPYVTSQRYPAVEGVVVVAEGAGQAGIRAEITETVLALFPVEAHKVKVLSKG